MADDTLGRGLARADRHLATLENGLNLFGGGLVFALMFLGVAQIILRNVFSAPLFGYIDIVEIGMVGFAVLAISFVQRVGGHVRMELLISRFKGRAHWVVEAIGTMLAWFVVFILIPQSYNHFERAWNFGDSTIDIELPTWPAKLAIPFALTILLIRLTIQLLGFLRMAANPELKPIAVPLIQSVEEQAEDEILHAEEDILHEHLSEDERRGSE